MLQFRKSSTRNQLSLRRNCSSHSSWYLGVYQYSNLLSNDMQNVLYKGTVSSPHSPSYWFLLSHEKSSKLKINTKTIKRTHMHTHMWRWKKIFRGSYYEAGGSRKEKHNLWLICRRLQIALGNNLSTPDSPPSIHLHSFQPKENKLNSSLPGPTCRAARLSKTWAHKHPHAIIHLCHCCKHGTARWLLTAPIRLIILAEKRLYSGTMTSKRNAMWSCDLRPRVFFLSFFFFSKGRRKIVLPERVGISSEEGRHQSTT